MEQVTRKESIDVTDTITSDMIKQWAKDAITIEVQKMVNQLFKDIPLKDALKSVLLEDSKFDNDVRLRRKVIKDTSDIIASNMQVTINKNGKCTWTWEDKKGYSSTCGIDHLLLSDAADVRYCMYCGKEIIIKNMASLSENLDALSSSKL